MKVTVEKPRIISLLYKQEKTDKDYGSCLWARFYFDLEHYTMSIESDCGNYSYGWTPTPDHESFLHLCTRLGTDYLLGKFSSLCVVDHNKTWEEVQEIIADILDGSCTEVYDSDIDKIRRACYDHRTAEATARAIEQAMYDADLTSSADELTYEICEAVIEDYPRQAKKIVEIYDEHIRPVVIKLEKGETNDT